MEGKKKMGKGKIIAIVVIVIFVIGAIGSCVDGESTSSTSSASQSSKYESLKEGDAFDAYNQLKTDGYSVTVVQEGTGLDQTSSYELNTSREDFEFAAGGPWIVTNVKVNENDKIATIEAQAASQIEREAKDRAEEEAMEQVLDIGHALVAVENYGEQQYPYGFKCHSVAGVISKEVVDGSWHIKVTCDVTNAAGAKAEGLTCEAVVTGTDAAPSERERTMSWIRRIMSVRARDVLNASRSPNAPRRA